MFIHLPKFENKLAFAAFLSNKIQRNASDMVRITLQYKMKNITYKFKDVLKLSIKTCLKRVFNWFH